MTQPNDFMIGTIAGGIDGMVTLASILSANGIPYDPDCPYTDFSGSQDMEDTTQRGTGYSTFQWSWEGLSDAQRAALRTYCAALSSSIFVRTMTNETSSGLRVWHTFIATMIWPKVPESREGATIVDVGYTLKFTLTFRALQQQD